MGKYLYALPTVKHHPCGLSNRPLLAARRRRRMANPLASPAAVRSVCHAMWVRIPDVILPGEKELIQFLNVIRHMGRRPVANTLRGMMP